MLIDIDTGHALTHIPHKESFHTWRGRLSDGEYRAIEQELNRRIAGGEVHTAGWIPGADWRGTVFQPIYDHACHQDAEQAGLCFGLIMWVVMQRRPERWGFGRYEKDGIPIRSLT